MSRLRLGIVGAGMAAKPHGQSLAALSDRIDVAGVYTRNPDSRNAFAAEHGFAAVSDIATLLDDPTVEAMLILTPPDARAVLLEACARAGKHILCEKPLERTAQAAEAAALSCEAAGVRLGIVFQHRFRAASQKLAEILAGGALGPIRTVTVDVPWWRPQSYYDAPGRGTLARDGGGVLISQAIHTLDLMLALAAPDTGPVTEVQALAGTSGFHQMETEDFIAGGLRFASGALGSVTATTASFPGTAESIRLGCDRGSATLQHGVLRVDWCDRPAETFGDAATGTGGGADPMAFPFDWHRDLIAAFAEAVQAGRQPVPSGRDAIRVQALIDALLRSSNEGRRIQLASPPQPAPVQPPRVEGAEWHR